MPELKLSKTEKFRYRSMDVKVRVHDHAENYQEQSWMLAGISVLTFANTLGGLADVMNDSNVGNWFYVVASVVATVMFACLAVGRFKTYRRIRRIANDIVVQQPYLRVDYFALSPGAVFAAVSMKRVRR